ncbi:hypothetical protein AAFF_G00428460 [Aldrovandia affinis]|uniref:Ubiquitin carboxyl-terminal hydrolase n=1 Tax=Aldrovandia affinis TaxID=143900 RepID=A0AAD7WII0_9TELE|nr:hypothetical protein AAFF_G00428460 [Aldrovandia affinis]
MAVETWALAVAESQWAPEECPGGGGGAPVSVTSDRDGLCAPGLFRSWKVVRPFARVKSGPTGARHRQPPAKELFTELLGRRTIEELCRRANANAEPGERPRALRGPDLLAWVAVALQGGLIPGPGGRKAAAMPATVDRWRHRFERSLPPGALLNLSGRGESADDQWDAFHRLQGNISQNFQTLYTPGERLSVRKYALSYRGHPARCRLKLALLCDAETGYVCGFFLYSPDALQSGSKSPVAEQVLHRLLRPYYHRGHRVQLDSSAHMEGRLGPVFSGLGVHLEFVSLWSGEDDDAVRPFPSSPPSPSPSPSLSPSGLGSPQQQGDCGTVEDPAALLRAHLRGWVGVALVPGPWEECGPAVCLQGLWLAVHLACIDAFVLRSLRSQEPGHPAHLCHFAHGLATELAVEYLPSTPLATSPAAASLASLPGVQNTAASSTAGPRAEEEEGGGGSSRRASVVQCPGLCGLENCGNSCYMNAVLQCLLCTVTLVEHFLNRQNRSDIARLQSPAVAGPFLRLVEEVWLAGRDSWCPSEMKGVVCALHPQFDNSCQQDAQELLLFLLNGLHDDLKKKEDGPLEREREKKREPVCSPERGTSPGPPGEASIVTRLFEGRLSYVTLCMQCSHQVQQSQVFTMLSLPVPNHLIKCSLQDCLALFFQQSTLTHTERMLCPECGLRQDTAVHTTVVKHPDILVLHLKRFECRGNNKRKLKTNVVFPLENLDLTPFTPSPSPPHTRYSLYSVVNHSGNLDMGHYTAYCHNAHTRSWHRFDDGAVGDVQDHLVQSLGAYILFYSREKFRRPRILGL